MIFSLPVQYKAPDGRTVEAMVDFYVDEQKIAATLGPRAVANVTQRSVELWGAVVAEVRAGSHREVVDAARSL